MRHSCNQAQMVRWQILTGCLMQAGFAFSKLADRLSGLTDLTAQDLDLLADMPSTIVHVGAHQTVVRHHGETGHCCRSEERRVGKECRCWWWRYREKKYMRR